MPGDRGQVGPERRAQVQRREVRAVGQDLDRDVRAITRQRLVDGVVNDLGHEMMKTSRVRRTDIHARALPYGIEPLEHLDVGRVVAVFDFFHASSLR